MLKPCYFPCKPSLVYCWNKIKPTKMSAIFYKFMAYSYSR